MTRSTRRYAPARTYEEFDLKIGGTDRLELRVLRSPCGTPSARFVTPEFARPAELERFRAALEALICGERAPQGRGQSALRPSSRDTFDEPTDPDPAAVGDALFRSLFPGPVRESLLQSLASLHARDDGGLRIRLHFDPSDPQQAALCRLPWELLYRAEARHFLALDRRSTVVRCLDVPQLSRAPRRSGRLRVAVLAPRPLGVEAPEGGTETAALRDALLQHPAVEMQMIEPPTLVRVREVARSGSFDVLHFMGHGALNDATGEGCLLFESPDKTSHLVTGPMLAQTLRAGVGLGFVFLNACDGARLPRRPGQDPYAGVATALVMSGIPATLAMQFPISEDAALAFSRGFYGALAEGDPLDAAAVEGRVAVQQAIPATWEWATPALYMSTAATAPWLLTPGAADPPSGQVKAAFDSEREGSGMKHQGTGGTVSITGNRGIAIGSADGSQISIHEAPSPREEARRNAAAGCRALEQGLYSEAERFLQTALATHPESGAERYHLALARAGRRGLFALTGEDMRLIEEQLGAGERIEREHLLLLAAVKDAYYARHGMTMPPPTPRQLLAEASRRRPRPAELQELSRHIDWRGLAARYGMRSEELAR